MGSAAGWLARLYFPARTNDMPKLTTLAPHVDMPGLLQAVWFSTCLLRC